MGSASVTDIFFVRRQKQIEKARKAVLFAAIEDEIP
jgi:hypothetical protein